MSTVESLTSLTPACKITAQDTQHDFFSSMLAKVTMWKRAFQIPTVFADVLAADQLKCIISQDAARLVYMSESEIRTQYVVCFSLLPGNIYLFKILGDVVCRSHISIYM